jgi:hypothetical protein
LLILFPAVFDAMTLSRCPGDKVEKEYKVNPLSTSWKEKGKALDVVYIKQNTLSRQVIN